MKKEIPLKSKVLAKNDEIATRLRNRFTEQGILSLNLIGSPGSGKTTLLEALLPRLKGKLSAAVVEGDVKTDNDMQRILAAGSPSVQIETEGGCHLNAEQVEKALESIDQSQLDLVIIENVGNLICPVSYQLGEHKRVIVLSLTEGDDKPLKYPSAFTATDMVIISKIDLAPYVDASAETMKNNVLAMNPNQRIFTLSAKTGDGLDELIEYLIQTHAAGELSN